MRTINTTQENNPNYTFFYDSLKVAIVNMAESYRNEVGEVRFDEFWPHFYKTFIGPDNDITLEMYEVLDELFRDYPEYWCRA
ncbi:MAG: hypothetical protein KC777_08325 [Cyanobacteria bacterium HKST-UBA02]|nr:hypothetical protein [Cyanobacteria bacterium HKST-UBA02]